jgi:hypothetical protein
MVGPDTIGAGVVFPSCMISLGVFVFFVFPLFFIGLEVAWWTYCREPYGPRIFFSGSNLLGYCILHYE